MVFTTCYVLGFAVLLPLGRASVLIGIALFLGGLSFSGGHSRT